MSSICGSEQKVSSSDVSLRAPFIENNKLTGNHFMLEEKKGGLSEGHFRCGRHEDTQALRTVMQ